MMDTRTDSTADWGSDVPTELSKDPLAAGLFVVNADDNVDAFALPLR